MKIITLTFLLLLNSCSEYTSQYINESKSCALSLNEDHSYTFSFPNLFGTKTEKGTYEINKNSIILKRKSFNKIDSIEISYQYSWNKNTIPDSLFITLQNLNAEAIKGRIKFNNFDKNFESNNLGELKVSYQELEKLGVIELNKKIEKFIISYGGNTYLPDMSYYTDKRRPTRIGFKLNQFVGKEYAILKRKYKLNNDTILINDISRKSIGKDDKMIKIK